MFLEWNSSKRCLSVLQVMTQGERAPQLDRTIDPQLLKMALAPHPRLRAALFPSGVSAGGASSDISIYHLLQVSTSLLNSEYPSWARKRFKRGGLKSGCHDSPGWMRTLTAILALCCSRSTPWIPAFCLAGKRQTPSTPLVRPPLPHPPYTHRCCPVVCFRYHQQGWSGLDSVWHLTNNFFANLQSLSKQLGSSARTFNRGNISALIWYSISWALSLFSQHHTDLSNACIFPQRRLSFHTSPTLTWSAGMPWWRSWTFSTTSVMADPPLLLGTSCCITWACVGMWGCCEFCMLISMSAASVRVWHPPRPLPFRLQRAWTPVYQLALRCFHMTSVTSAAVCFCELLGISSIKLRVDVKAVNTIRQHWNQSSSRSTSQNLQTLGKRSQPHSSALEPTPAQ